MDARTIFGRNVKRFRLERKWTQADLGEAAGMDAAEISRIENATFSSTLDRVDAVSAALGKTPKQMLESVGASETPKVRGRPKAAKPS